jgi:hypothetical protein
MTRISLDVREFGCVAPGNSRIAPLISRNSKTKQQQNNVINVRERTLAGRCFNQANVVGCRIKATPLYSAVN